MTEQLTLDLDGDNVSDLFPDLDLPFFMPVEPLRPLLRRAELMLAGTSGHALESDCGRMELARRISMRIGGNPESRQRLLERIHNGHKKVLSFWMADQLACAIGLHPALVWDDWGRERAS